MQPARWPHDCLEGRDVKYKITIEREKVPYTMESIAESTVTLPDRGDPELQLAGVTMVAGSAVGGWADAMGFLIARLDKVERRRLEAEKDEAPAADAPWTADMDVPSDLEGSEA
jgi:hypothetical protein